MNGGPMSDTEVDGTPDGVAEHGERASEPVDAGRGPGQWRSALIIAPLFAGLLLAAGLGARMLLAEIPDPEPVDAVADATCWDGETRPADECAMPSGRAGLRWVFPSFRPDDLGCRNVLLDRPKSKRPTMFECEDRVGSEPVTITYSELNGVEQARRYLEKAYGSPPEEVAGDGSRRLVWTEGDEAGDDVYKLDVIYADLPYGVEVRADSAQARDRALDSLVRFRPEDQISVRP